MSDSSAIISGAAGRYATALFELAKASDALDTVSGDMTALIELADGNAEFAGFLKSPGFSSEDKAKAVTAIAQKAGYSDLTTKTLGLMGQKGRLDLLPQMARGFSALVLRERDEAVAEVTAAKALSDAQMQRLKDILKKTVGKDVAVQTTIDPNLIGGLIVKLGSKMVDASLSSKLSRLGRAMKEAQ